MRYAALVLGLLIFAADWLTKWWVTNTGWLRYYTVIEDFFRIHYVENEGIAFGFFHSFDSVWKIFILSGMAVIAIFIVLYYIRTTPPDQVWLFISFGLLLGGILGNFTDRVVNGYVVDFIELHWRDRVAWPTFNVADMAISSGVLMILYETFFGEDPRGSQEQSEVVSTK